MPEPIIELERLCCVSGNRYLVQNINWTIKKGERWLLFGSNGCGKTTLLSVLAGFRKYDMGSAKIFGEQYTEENIIAMRKKIGWISGSFFDKHYHQERAWDIVLSGLSGGLSKSFDVSNNDLKQARRLMEILNLKGKLERPFDMMSKGERQNVLIARALIANPEILILDEPGTGLDVFARSQMLETVTYMTEQQGSTIIYVTHYPEEILPMFDQCVLMKQGTIYAKGKTNELFQDKCMSGFVGKPVHVEQTQGKYFII